MIMRIPIGWSTDEFGRITGARLHDSYISKILFSDGDTFNLEIHNLYGDIIEINAIGISDINIVEFCNGAIVSSIYFWNINAVPEGWDITDSAWNILFFNRIGSSGAKEKAAKIAKDKPNSFLMKVECSYGGMMALICDNVNIFKVS